MTSDPSRGCSHKRTSRLKSKTEDGGIGLTDWVICRICGALKIYGSKNWREPAEKAMLFDLLMKALPDSSTEHISWLDLWIEIPKYGKPRQYLANWVEEYKEAHD